MTPRAARRIAEILSAEGGEAVLRVAVTGGGCSGFQYSFALDDARADAVDFKIGGAACRESV
jgi:Fe-S cluster assembly iron-binding protein IscA